MELSLWAALLARPLTDEEEAELLRLLPAGRRTRLLAMKNREKWREPLCAYTILRYALYRSFAWKELPPIELNRYGKPFFPDFPTVHFNLSHTKGAVLVGLHDEPLGVDMEHIRPISEQASRRLAGVASERAFFESWVRRESRSKRAGNGLGSILREETPLQCGEHFYFMDTFPGYVAGISTCSHQLPGTIKKLSLEDIV